MISFAEFRPAPQPRTEIRSDATAQLITALTAAVSGSAVQTWAAGAVECAAGLWERALSTADVKPDGAAPIGPRWLAEVGRDLARHGEAVHLVDVAPAGRVRLLRATSTDVWGDGPDPADWWYRLTLTGPAYDPHRNGARGECLSCPVRHGSAHPGARAVAAAVRQSDRHLDGQSRDGARA